MSELRKDPVIGRWVIISAHRGKRPFDFKVEKEQVSDISNCPFCMGNEHMTPPEIIAFREKDSKKNGPGWWLRVFSNKYPALQVEGKAERTFEGMYEKINGIGAHEVIVETPNHKETIGQMPQKQVEDILWAYKERILDLKNDSRLEYILIFKNHGRSAGASLSHPHSQLIATPTLPKRVKEEMNGAEEYFNKNNSQCVFCDIVNQELEKPKRLVRENKSFIAICPYASRFPFEVWILPKAHEAHFCAIEKNQIADLAEIMKDVLKRLEVVLESPSYNYMIHNSPLNTGQIPFYHWHIEIIPKLTSVAGFEWGTGFYINPTPPEEAAKFLREA
ncbi:MAG: galactose-1-phosphate uridylyltransferase [Elusimicrobiota bacterium]